MGYISGNDGSVDLGEHGAQFNTWNATFSRQVSDITGFSDAGRRRRLGVWDASGSAGGFMLVGGAGAAPGINTSDWQTDGNAMTFYAKTGTAGGASLSFSAVISEIALSMTKTGDAAISFNWQLAGGAVPTETWSES